jgi:cell division protein FtsW
MVINVAVATGSMPVTGVTLPFISYGGSSLIPKMAGVGILLNISRYRRAEKAENKTPLEEAIL